MRNESNVWCSEDSQIKEIATQYYQTLFSLTHPTEFDAVLEAVQPSVTQEMNDQLLKPFSRDEVETAINQMEPITAPGLDSMLPLFINPFGLLLVMRSALQF